jgi:hypothetical protein
MVDFAKHLDKNKAGSLWAEDAKYLLALARDVLVHHHTNTLAPYRYQASALATSIDDFLSRGVSPQLPFVFTKEDRINEYCPEPDSAASQSVEDLL